MSKGQKNLGKGIAFTYNTSKSGYWFLALLAFLSKLKCPFNRQSGNEVVINERSSQEKKRHANKCKALFARIREPKTQAFESGPQKGVCSVENASLLFSCGQTKTEVF